ncbi:MAG: S8 family peptidase, partial [Defluviitaleaceae bacterium]|nr:S8 family peptidase [Defluviitaleaceae bacterium]
MKALKKTIVTLTLLLTLSLVTLPTQAISQNPYEVDDPVVVSFTSDVPSRLVEGDIAHVIPRGGTVTEPPIFASEGRIFNGWDKDLSNITEDTVVMSTWLNIGAVSTGGLGYVSTQDLIYLAWNVVGSPDHEIADYRISNLYGEDRPPTEEDVRMLLQYLVGYRIEDLTYRESDVGMPTIEVVSEIPRGGLTVGSIAIEYVATPSEGAYIDRVWYQYGHSQTAVYLSETNRNGPRGTLGQARLPLRYEGQENKLTLHVEDSAGLTATYEIEDMPYRIDLSYVVPNMPAAEDAFSDTHRVYYTNNRLYVDIVGQADPGDIDMDAIAEAFATIEGEIERFNGWTLFTIYVPPTDEDGLTAKGEYLLENYPHLFRFYYIGHFAGISGSGDTATKGGGFFESGVTTGSSFRTNNRSWWHLGHGWPLHIVGFPWAWSVFGAQVRQGVEVGIIDDGVNHEHPSLQMLPSHTFKFSPESHGDGSHGTEVMGVIAATHNTAEIAVGAINIDREYLYSYNSYETRETIGGHRNPAILAGLEELVKKKGVRVINVSIVGAEPIDPFMLTEDEEEVPRFPAYNDTMNKLMTGDELLEEEGSDFLIIHAAGNRTWEARNNGVFAFVTEPDLRKRIITVGSSTRNGAISDFSNYGPYVDVVALGTLISVITDEGIRFFSGTSYSAPAVSALAALIWAEAPDLTPERVKEIIVQSAYSHGRRIVDNRTNIPEEHRNRTYYEINAPAALFMARGIDPNSYLGNPRDLTVKPYRAVVVGHV